MGCWAAEGEEDTSGEVVGQRPSGLIGGGGARGG